MVLSPVSLGGSTYFLRKKCVVFQQTKNNFYLSCQFFENRRSMRMLLFLPYDRSDRTFYSQAKVNSKTSKVIASRCYTWSLSIKKSLNRQGSVNQMENSSKSSSLKFIRLLRVVFSSPLCFTFYFCSPPWIVVLSDC